MKAKIWLAAAAAAVLMSAGLNPAGSPRLNVLGEAMAQTGIRVDFGYFYDELAPYGDWRQVEPHGWVWYPDVAQDWRPYTVGYWVFTDDYGWTWIAADPWGSIPFHYGRWFYDGDSDRWAWVPGTEWGPAWVGWRSGGGYVGWAPLPPEVRFDPGAGFAPSERDFGVTWNSWCFVPTARLLSPRLERVIVPRPRNVTIINNTVNVTRYTVIGRRVVNRGIDLDRFERETRSRVVRYRVDDIDRPVRRGTPVRNGRVVLFRPEVIGSATTPPPAVRPPRWGASPDRRPERREPGAASWERRPDDWGQDRRERGEWPGADRPERRGPGSTGFDDRDGRRPATDRQTPDQQRQEAERERARRWAEREQRQQAEQDRDRQRAEQERAQRQAEREQARDQQMEQERARREAEREAQRQADQTQRQAEREEQRRAEREAQRQAEQAQRQAEREQARQQVIQQRQQAEQEQARQQRMEQERAQRQAEREAQRQAEQAQRQAEREAQRQAEREAQRQAEQARRQAEREAQRQAEQAQRQAEREQARQQAAQQQQQQRQQQAEQERQRRRNLPECKSLPPGQQQECR